MSRRPLTDAARAASVLGVLGLLAVLAYYLPSPGYRPSRLYLFLPIGVVGAAGAVVERPLLVGGSAAGIFLLGFWQAVLGVVMLPVTVVLFLTAFLVDDAGREASPETP